MQLRVRERVQRLHWQVDPRKAMSLIGGWDLKALVTTRPLFWVRVEVDSATEAHFQL